MSIKVSIIVPVYQVEKYLPECLDSILNQTYKNIEIIIVDDGSPDRCPLICDKYAEKDSRIRVIHQNNQGLSSARNTGIQYATGDYIAFIDSDDKIKDTFIEVLLSNLLGTKADVSCCNFIWSYPEYDKANKIKIMGTLSKNEIIKIYTTDCTPLFLNVVWNKLYKRDLFYPYGSLQFKKGKLQEDNFFVCDLLDKIQNMVITNISLYYYRQRPNSIMSNLSNKFIHDTIDSYIYLYKKFSLTSKYKVWLNIFLVNSMVSIIARCVKNKCYYENKSEINRYSSFCCPKIKFEFESFDLLFIIKYILIKLKLVKLISQAKLLLRRF